MGATKKLTTLPLAAPASAAYHLSSSIPISLSAKFPPSPTAAYSCLVSPLHPSTPVKHCVTAPFHMLHSTCICIAWGGGFVSSTSGPIRRKRRSGKGRHDITRKCDRGRLGPVQNLHNIPRILGEIHVEIAMWANVRRQQLSHFQFRSNKRGGMLHASWSARFRARRSFVANRFSSPFDLFLSDEI